MRFFYKNNQMRITNLAIKAKRKNKNRLKHFLGLTLVHGQRNSPQKMNSGLRLNRKFFVRALFALKNYSQGSFTTRRDP